MSGPIDNHETSPVHKKVQNPNSLREAFKNKKKTLFVTNVTNQGGRGSLETRLSQKSVFFLFLKGSLITIPI